MFFYRKKRFKCCIYPSLSHIHSLVKKRLLFIYIVLKKDDPVACYIFRNPFTKFKHDITIGKSLDCICSFYDDEVIFQEIFIYYFYFSLFQARKQLSFKFFVIENISNNNYIIKNIFRKYTPIIKSPTAYYFYNFAYRPLISSNCFLLN